MKKAVLFSLSALALLSACGGREALKPKPGQSAVPIAKGATEADTPQELMTPSPQARPDRNAELLRKSQERPDDPFDLPPK